MFGWEFPPFNSGGLGVACWGITKGLSDQGENVLFVLPKKYDVNNSHVKFLFADTKNISIKTFDSYLKPYLTSEAYLRDKKIAEQCKYGDTLLAEVLRYGEYAKTIARDNDHDVIHAHDWLSFPAGIEAKKVSKKPLIAHVHATEHDRTGGRGVNKDVFEIEEEGMRKADIIIAVSNFTKKIIVDKYNIDPSKIEVVHNGINMNEYEGSDRKFDMLKLKEFGIQIVLFAGRLTLQKGPDYFLKTAKEVIKYVPNSMFVIAGSGDMEHQIMRQAAEIGISNKVSFVGYLRGDELNSIYKSADVLVMPSVSEPFGITALEALANKTPVLVSKQSGVAEVITHALKADFWDVDEMVNKITVLLKNKSLQQCLQENGNKEVRKLSWTHAAKKCVNLYKKLLKKSN
jgi:glycosyltransferase involved in cell wall biosynthesis